MITIKSDIYCPSWTDPQLHGWRRVLNRYLEGPKRVCYFIVDGTDTTIVCSPSTAEDLKAFDQKHLQALIVSATPAQ